MYKNLFIIMSILILGLSNAIAGQDLRHGSNNECYYISNYGSKKAGNNWAYYFCGVITKKCDGKKHKGHDMVKLQFTGDSFSWGGKTYWCCNDTAGSAGRYVEATKWITHEETKTKTVGNGTCDIKIQTDVCGNMTTVDCDSPGKCNSGFIMRNGVCAEICPDGQAYESLTSNNCIDCETTNYQGIQTIGTNGHKVCKKCENQAKFFDRRTQTCISKDNMKQIPGWAMKKCFMCPDSELFQRCTEIVQRPFESLNFASNDESAVLKRCHVDENSLDKLTK